MTGARAFHAARGGHIWVYSEPGRGTTFKIYLPAVTDEVVDTTPGVEASESPRGSETVLLVDDPQDARELRVADVALTVGHRLRLS